MDKLKTPKGWRKGQTIFNFLEWLHTNRGYSLPAYTPHSRMADPFHIPDVMFDDLYNEFLKEIT